MKNPATEGTSQQAPPPLRTPSQQTSSKTPDQGAPMLQAGDFPPLMTDAGARKQPNKNSFSDRQRSEGLPPPSPYSSLPHLLPEFLELKQELAVLRAQHVHFKLKLLPRTGSPPVPRVTPHQYYHSCSRADGHVHHSVPFRSLLTLKNNFRLLKVL
ncbi:hypothetical protein MRX96_050964 [Rhipicephalus microplus]